MTIPVLTPRIWTAEELLGVPGYYDCLVQSASELLATHDELPREVRYLADLRRWLLSQATLALHFEYLNDPETCPPLTPGALQRLLAGTRAASRNTISAFLQELEHFGLAQRIAARDRRSRAVIASPMTEALIRHWFGTHLVALDRIDGADRQGRFTALPDLLSRAQPRMLRLILAEPRWLDPGPAVTLFTDTDSGSNILHHILVRAPRQPDAPWFSVGPVSARGIARHFLISQSHTGRLLNSAEQAGLLRWTGTGRRGDCLVARSLLEDYRAWQAVKFATLSRAFGEALAGGSGHNTPAGSWPA